MVFMKVSIYFGGFLQEGFNIFLEKALFFLRNHKSKGLNDMGWSNVFIFSWILQQIIMYSN